MKNQYIITSINEEGKKVYFLYDYACFSVKNRMFITLVDNNQKVEGTTFKNWLEEMEHMQILNRIV